MKKPQVRDVCCPALQLLANMGIIKPSNITSVDLKRGLDLLGFESGDDSPFVKLLMKLSSEHGTVSFETMNLHNGPAGECDASLSRCDYHTGDSVRVNKERVRCMLACSSDKRHISLRDLVHFQLQQVHESLAHESFRMSMVQFIAVRIFNIASLFVLLSDGDKGIPVKRIWPFFIHGRLPSDWTKPKITQRNFMLPKRRFSKILEG